VEIYRNQALLAFQADRPDGPDGRYEFLNLPLSFGLNDFRLVFYGPQGKRREENYHFDVGTNQTQPGEFNYQIVGLEGHQIGAKPRGYVDFRYGLSKQFALGTSYSELNLNGQNHGYSEARLVGFGGLFTTTLSAAKDKLGGSVEELALRSRIGSTDFVLQRDQLQDGFVSEQFQSVQGAIKDRSSLQVTTYLPSLQKSLASLSLGAQRTDLVSGASDSTYSGRLSAYLWGYNLSNAVTRLEQRDTNHKIVSTTSSGSFFLSKSTSSFFLQGQADYDLNGPRKLTSYGATLESLLVGLYNLWAGATHTIATNTTTYLAGLSNYQGAFALGLDLGYAKLSRFTVNLNLRFGLAREPRTGRIAARVAGVASQGAVSTLAFVDAAGSEAFERCELKPVANVAYRADGLTQPGVPDAQGVGFLTNLPVYRGANISVDSNFVEDPAMRAANAGYRITPRPGHVALLDMPMVITGEVTGTARLKGTTGSTELAGLQIVLVDVQGKVVKKLRTSFDGYYPLADIHPGSYQVQVPVSELERLGVAPPAPKPVHIDATGTQIDGLDLELSPLAPQTPTSPKKGNP